MRRPPHRRAAAWLLPLALAAAAPPAARADAVPLAVGAGFETLRLPGDERMGLASGAVLFGIGPGWWAGPAVFGAATGQRGGLFVLGAQIERRWALAPGLTIAAGLAAGGGGGAAAPVGDGLMLRPALTLRQSFGAFSAGVSASQARFAGSAIRSEQVGLVLEFPAAFDHLAPERAGERVSAPGRSGLGLDAIALTASRLALDGSGAAMDFRLLGVRVAQQPRADGANWGVEAAAATQSERAGYMEILGFVGRDVALGPVLRVGGRASAGLGGGGGVPAGGGAMARLDGTVSAALGEGWRIGGALGRQHGAARAFRGERAELWLSAELEPAGAPGTPGRAGTVARTEWSAALQRVTRVDRSDGSTGTVDTVGLVLNRWLGEHGFASGQAHSAFAGGAGGYSIGLVGGGWASRRQPDPWQFGVEALVGGAGGGGVASLSGAVGQALAWAAWAPAGSAASWRLGAGSAAPLHGSGRASPVVTLGWTTAFGQPGR